jgi:hypothetical protein
MAENGWLRRYRGNYHCLSGVVSLKHVARLLPSSPHRYPFWDPRSYKASHHCTPEVVNESFSGNPCLFASPLVRLIEDRDAW